MTKKLLSFLLVFVMAFSTLQLNVFATELGQDEQIVEIEQTQGEIEDEAENEVENEADNATDNEADDKTDETMKDNLIADEPVALTAMPFSSDNEFLAPISPGDQDAIAISTVEELRSIADGGSYYLANDIDFGSNSWSALNITGRSITLDGQGHKLLNYKVGDITYSGLFGQLTSVTLTIKNLGIKPKDRISNASSASGYSSSLVACLRGGSLRIENCYSEINVDATKYSGGIVGEFNSLNGTLIIENCYNLGSIQNGYGVFGNYGTYTGGIIGGITACKEARIINCYNEGVLISDGTSNNVGGILGGISRGSVEIENCRNAANLSGVSVGGILGSTGSGLNDVVEIDNCYNTGDIRAIDSGNASGIMGSGTGSIYIANCYNTGTVTSAGGSIDGIYCPDTNATINNCYYLDTAVATSTNGISKTDAEMKSQQTFQGFDFDNIWEIDSRVNSGYPTLRSNLTSNSALKKLFSISGTITNNGTTLSDITVILKDKDGKPAYSTKSDENGVYSFIDIPKSNAPYNVMIDSRKYDADDVEIIAPYGAGVIITADIEVIILETIIPKDEEDYTIRGTVSGTGNNINGLKLIINPTGETVSENNGVYSHTLHGGTGYTLIAGAPGYITQKVDIVFPQGSKELVLDILLQTDTQTAGNNFSVDNPNIWLDATLISNPSFLVNVGNAGSSHIIIQSPSSLVGTDVTIKVGEFPAAGLRFDEIDKNNHKVTNKDLFGDGTIKSAEYRFTTETGTDKINTFSITVINPQIPRYEIPVYAIYNDKQGAGHQETIGWIIINIPMSVVPGEQPKFQSLTLTGPSTHKTGNGITVTGKVAGDNSEITIYRVLSDGTEVVINKEPTTPLGVSAYSANIADLPKGINKLVARTANGTVSNYHYIFVRMSLQVEVQYLRERVNNPGNTPRDYGTPSMWYGAITAVEAFSLSSKPFFNLTLYFYIENKGDYEPVVSFVGKNWEPILLRESNLNGATIHYYKCDIDNWFARSVSEMYIDLLDENNPKIKTLAAVINTQHDPSGYVYDVDAPDERIAGATAILQKLVGSEWNEWVDPEKRQENPQITNSEGRYEWYVEEGTYRVLISKDKYTNVIDKGGVAIANMPDGSFNSEIPNGSQIIVLPPHFDVNVPLKRTEYNLSVNGGTGGGNKAWGREVTVTADTAPSGQRFKHFTATGLSKATYTTNPLTFTMPDNAVSLTAVYEYKPSGSGSVTGGGSTNSSKNKDEIKKTEEAATDKKPEPENKPTDLTSQVANYTDVPTNAWYYNAILPVTSKGLFKGTSKNTFEPNTLMTRAMFVTVLANLEGVDLLAYNKATFSDVEANAWFAKQVAWASEFGIVNGVTNNNFAPNKPITREEMAVMFNNYIKIRNIELPKNGSNVAFEDINTASAWAKEAIVNMRSTGIVNGFGDNNYAPKATATRSEVAQIFANYLNIMDK